MFRVSQKRGIISRNVFKQSRKTVKFMINMDYIYNVFMYVLKLENVGCVDFQC